MPRVRHVCECEASRCTQRVVCGRACAQGKFVTAGPWAKDCIPDERVLEETQLRFPPFVLPMPRFVSSQVPPSPIPCRAAREFSRAEALRVTREQDRQWFVKLAVVQEYINSSLECFKRPPPPGVLCPLLDSHTSPDDVRFHHHHCTLRLIILTSHITSYGVITTHRC
jgi:hypothetical protein